MYLSIVIVNWNSNDTLRNCVRSILTNKPDFDYEVLIIDNNSSDDSLEGISENNIKIIRNDQNLGFSKACNQGIKLSKGKYILLLNPDTLVMNNSLNKMVYFLDDNKNVGILGCKLLNPDGSVQPSCHTFLTLTNVFFEVSQLNRLFPKNKFFIKTLGFLSNYFSLFTNYKVPTQPLEIDSVMGSCYMIQEEALQKVGLFDENFFLYHEEMELSYRIWQEGYKVMFYPFASVTHYGKYSTKRVPNFVYYERCKSILYFFRKHKHSQIRDLKSIMLISLFINFFSVPFKKDFRSALSYRLKVFKLIINY